MLQFFYASTHLDLFSHWICSGAWRWKGNSIKIHLNRAPDLLQIKSGREKSIMTQWMIEFCLQSTNGSSFFFYPPSRLSLWPKCSKTCLMQMNDFLEQTALWNNSLYHWKSIMSKSINITYWKPYIQESTKQISMDNYDQDYENNYRSVIFTMGSKI